MHTSVLEGVNNRIKVIKRMAYGFRDSEYFFLKIKAAFGKRDEPKKAANPAALFTSQISDDQRTPALRRAAGVKSRADAR